MMTVYQKALVYGYFIITVHKQPDLTKPCKQQLHLVLDYRSLNKSTNAAHNGNIVIFYNPLPIITYLLARLQYCTIFSSLDVRLPPHRFNTWSKAENCLSTTSGIWHWNMAPFWHMLTPRSFLLTYVRGLVRVRFLLRLTWRHINLQHVMEGAPASY